MTGPCPVVVIGGSAGALSALLSLISALPAGFPAAVLVVIHVPPDQPSVLAELLDRAGPLPAQVARRGVSIEPGRVYTAPPNHHLLLRDDQLHLSLGPRENRSRPSIDVLFRSAALQGADTVGVLLSGMLDDGVSGLRAIEQAGGLTAVQHPDEAECPDMPLNALKRVQVNEILPVGPLAAWLTLWAEQRRTANQEAPYERPPTDERLPMNDEARWLLQTELEIASGAALPPDVLLSRLPLSPLTCPECNGVLMQIAEGEELRYRCHTGHAYTVLTLVADLRHFIEETLWAGVRAINEHQILLSQLSMHLEDRGQLPQAEALRTESRQLTAYAEILRQMTRREPQIS